ncbi:hypothetical protein Q3G72_030902 [Acer saccharum]|nr:hypothetical protein Q3G72_030902 [Acer saccharum]
MMLCASEIASTSWGFTNFHGNGKASASSLCEESTSYSIDSSGSQCLSVFRSLGLPSTTVLIRFMSLFKEQRLTVPHWQNQRPYLMSQKVHVSGVGDFQLCKIEILKDLFPMNARKEKDAMESDKHMMWRITFKRIIRSKSTEQFSGIPYVMTLLNNLLTAWYGLPFVSENNILVSTINGTGAVIESIYVLIFIIYATKKEKAKIFGLLMFVLSMFAAVALLSLLALHGNTRNILCGFAAAIFSTIMYASPLSVVMMVIKTKSVEFMPFFLSLFVFLCSSSWFIFGLLGRDPFIAVPSGLGSGMGTVQLIFYFIYRNKV